MYRFGSFLSCHFKQLQLLSQDVCYETINFLTDLLAIIKGIISVLISEIEKQMTHQTIIQHTCRN